MALFRSCNKLLIRLIWKHCLITLCLSYITFLIYVLFVWANFFHQNYLGGIFHNIYSLCHQEKRYLIEKSVVSSKHCFRNVPSLCQHYTKLRNLHGGGCTILSSHQLNANNTAWCWLLPSLLFGRLDSLCERTSKGQEPALATTCFVHFSAPANFKGFI